MIRCLILIAKNARADFNDWMVCGVGFHGYHLLKRDFPKMFTIAALVYC